MSTNELLLKALRGEGQAHLDGKVRDRRVIGALLIAGHDAIEALQAENARLRGAASSAEAWIVDGGHVADDIVRDLATGAASVVAELRAALTDPVAPSPDQPKDAETNRGE